MISPPLRVVVADDDRSVLKIYEALLPKLGHEVVALVSSGAELVAACTAVEPNLVITDIKMPDMEGIEAVLRIYESRILPVILVSGYYDPKSWERAVSDEIVEFLLKPISLEGLEQKIAHVMSLYQQYELIRREMAGDRQALRHRRTVERAKMFLMRGGDLSDDQAFEQLCDSAVQQGQPINVAAQRIVSAVEATTM
jgi:response regulator NasT